MLWNVCEKQSALQSWALSPKSSLVSFLIIFAFVHHLTIHDSSRFLGCVNIEIKRIFVGILCGNQHIYTYHRQNHTNNFNSRLKAESCAFLL